MLESLVSKSRPATPSPASKKDIPLEAVRGVAAITVLLWHSTLGFFPQWSGIFPDKWPLGATLRGQAWFGLIYGTAAVTLFFVLSGFVLTRRFLITRDERLILRGAIKRWPRLAGPVFITVLVSWLLFKLGAYHFAEAGEVTGSPWLSKFANAFEGPFEPRFWGAVRQGAFWTFFRGDCSYDSSLWTMHYEFIGSFIAFGLALLIALFPKDKQFLCLAIVTLVFLLCYFASPIYASFPVGVALAVFLPKRQTKLPGWIVGGLILIALYLFGYTGEKIGSFYLLAMVVGRHAIPAEIVASVLLITAVELAPDAHRERLSGRTSQFIGTLSFPLYLIHVPVLCSFGCTVLIWARTWTAGPDPNVIAGVATIGGSFLAAIPLAFFNERWVAHVNTATNWLLYGDSTKSRVSLMGWPNRIRLRSWFAAAFFRQRTGQP